MGVSKVRGGEARAASSSGRSRLGGILAAAVLVGGLYAGAGPAFGQTNNNNTSNNTNTSENSNTNQNSNENNNTIVNTITNVNDITNVNVNENDNDVDVFEEVEIIEVFEPAHVAAAHQTGRLVVTG